MKTEPFNSLLANQIGNFWKYRQISQKSSTNCLSNLKNLDRFCLMNHPKEVNINENITYSWCKRRPKENNSSCNKRISLMRKLLLFLYRSGWLESQIILLSLRSSPCAYLPHFFSFEELQTFFYKCDVYPQGVTFIQKCKAMTAPVFFKLLYSSGLRTCEARKLMVDDIDLNTGKIAVINTKGTSDHYIVLHPSMLGLMKEYHSSMKKMIPERKYFFCFRQDEYYSKIWVSQTFKTIWDSCGFSHAVAYDLRHCYAITNINQQVEDMQEFSARFMCLSRSMGHASVESTRYYYSLFPDYYPQIIELSAVTCNEIIPEANDEER